MNRKIVFLGAGGLALVAVAAWMGYWYGYGARAAHLAASDDPADRLEAVRQLRGKNSGLAERTLAKLADDPDPRVAAWAIRALAASPTARRAELLGALLANGRTPAIRAEAAEAVGKLPDTDVQILIDVLADDSEDPAVRAGAARGLSHKKSIKALPALVDRLNDPDQDVRLWSITAIHNTVIVRFPYQAEAPQAKRTEQINNIKRILKKHNLLPDAAARKRQIGKTEENDEILRSQSLSPTLLMKNYMLSLIFLAVDRSRSI